MWLAYLDEVGESGAFVSKEDPKYNTSAGFGYAGFLIPEHRVREFGAIFTKEKRTLFAEKFIQAENQGAWEVKGSSVFRSKTPTYAPQNIRVFKYLSRQLLNLGGKMFYYVDEKPKGTPKQVSLNIDVVERKAMEEVLNRVCRAADKAKQNILFMIDSIDEDQRTKRLPNMYGHILGRAVDKPEMLRAIEPPMHVDSTLSAAIQFADWIAAIVNRAIEYQLLIDEKCAWVGKELWPMRYDLFTKESKLHFLPGRSVEDLYTWDILKQHRPLAATGTVGSDPESIKKMEKLFQITASQNRNNNLKRSR